MSSKTSFSIRVARRSLAALASLAVLSLAMPTASANIALNYSATDVGTSTTVASAPGTYTNTMTVPASGQLTVGHFQITISTTTNDPGGGTTTFPGSSTLSTTTIGVLNLGSSPSPDTLDLYVTGQGFTVGPNDVAKFTVSGTTGSTATAGDTTTGYSWVGPTNVAYGGTPLASAGTGTAIPPSAGLTGTPSSLSSSVSYTFANSGNSGQLGFSSSLFSLTQLLAITLGAGDGAQFTISTSATPTPEPSTMALAALGTLGLIGYGLRRRKAMGA